MTTVLSDYDNSPDEEGTLKYDGKWYLLEVSKEFHEKILKLADTQNLNLKPNKNPHISVMKGESASLNQEDWGKFDGEKIKFKFDQVIHCENGLHVWINVYSPRLCEIREHFGLVTLRRRDDDVYLVNFHMTLGKLKNRQQPNFRKQYRLCPQSHIDAETGMQHL